MVTVKGDTRNSPGEYTVTRDATSEATVLVVEDERHLADLYAEYLADDYSVITAYSGEEGIDRLRRDVDVAVVDRRMAGFSGHEVLAAIEESEVDCRVALVTASDPDFDIIGLGVDDYLVKPVTREDALDVVDRLLAVTEYTETLRTLTRKKLTRNVLRVEKSRSELNESDRYRRLQSDISRLERAVDELAERLDLEERSLTL